MKRMLIAVLALAVMAAGASVATAKRGGDDDRGASERVFTLQPDPAPAPGNPEGIAFDKRSRSFFVSITTSGDIYRGSLRSDTVEPFIEGEGNSVGIKVKRGKLYVAGGATGAIKVYDLASKALVAKFETGAGGFLNDLVVTRRGDVYVTDSLRQTAVARDRRAGRGGLRHAAGARRRGDPLRRGLQPQRHRRQGQPQARRGRLHRRRAVPDQARRGGRFDRGHRRDRGRHGARRRRPAARPRQARRGPGRRVPARVPEAQPRRPQRPARADADERRTSAARRRSTRRRACTSWSTPTSTWTGRRSRSRGSRASRSTATATATAARTATHADASSRRSGPDRRERLRRRLSAGGSSPRASRSPCARRRRAPSRSACRAAS